MLSSSPDGDECSVCLVAAMDHLRTRASVLMIY
jgi:hypothetical protein